ncbi:MAG: asparagine synthase (glutamine-hydrolyzing) [Planctomycetes bacterium]|nr:asparagine synthase (glutamine-hydrolyzing) [Planctomycetota bacterium]
MCGVAGFLDPRGTISDPRSTLARMAGLSRHRGPDAFGLHWEGDGLGFAHARLAILERSVAGAQPMESPQRRFVIAYNGEIYNHLELRRELGDGVAWRGSSDTETIVACFERWGVAATLPRLHGMFAIAAWERGPRVLWLARDPLGKKPMSVGWHGGVLAFASELHALAALPSWPPPIDRQALAAYVRYQCVPSPRTIHQGFVKLAPGSVVRIGPEDAARAGTLPSASVFWDPRELAVDGERHRLAGNSDDLAALLESALERAVTKRLLSDVPVGAFLSGGIDSGVVTALMARVAPSRVRTFSIGFEQSAYDERPLARLVANHLGTDHADWLVSPNDALDAAMDVGAVWDEPFADSSAIPSLLLARAVRSQVSVVLTGDGGDELFGGYQRYQHAHRLWTRAQSLPAPVRNAVVAALGAPPAEFWRIVASILPSGMLGAHPARAIRRGRQALAAESANALPRSVMTVSEEGPALVPEVVEAPTLLDHFDAVPQLDTFEARFMLADLMTYLPDDLLVKVDRACMSVGLEARCPMLDRDVVALSMRMPPHERLGPSGTKLVLRRLARKLLPEPVLRAPKRGFAVPLATWMSGPLRHWAHDMLSDATTSRCGLFDARAVRSIAARLAASEPDVASTAWTIATAHSWMIHSRRLVRTQADTLRA